MPYMCCVLKCSNSVLNPGRKNYSFHRFPKDEILLMKWLENIDRPNFVPTKHTRICSAHFEDWCFQREENQLKSIGIPVHRRSLRPEAVPTLFNVLTFVRKPTKVARKSKKKSDTKAAHSDAHITKDNNDGLGAACGQTYNHHSMDASYEGSTLNGSGTDYDSSSLAVKEERTSPESDTYELTELTPMVKQDRLSPIQNSFNDNASYHIIADLDGPFQVPFKETIVLQPTLGLMESLPPNTNSDSSSSYPDAFKKCIISESFLYTLLKLIKCQQCGFGINSEQMQKYENQGCILGVRLLCYNGHLVLDWRL